VSGQQPRGLDIEITGTPTDSGKEPAFVVPDRVTIEGVPTVVHADREVTVDPMSGADAVWVTLTVAARRLAVQTPQGPAGPEEPHIVRGPGARCCECESTRVAYRNYKEQPFCWPCADAQPWPVDPGTGQQTRAEDL
jgi:hypothetical protein